MSNLPTDCPGPARLRRLLEGSLPEVEECTLAAHPAELRGMSHAG